MNLPEILDIMRHTPWNFYSVCDGNFTHIEEYKVRRERLDEIGSMICSVGVPGFWVDMDTYDFTGVDRILELLLKDKPNRFCVPRFGITPPLAWMRANPEELCVYYGGPADKEQIAALVGSPYHDQSGWDEDEKPYPVQYISNQSFSSKKWVADASKAIKAFVKHLEEGPYSGQIIGYMPCSGNCGENEWWGDWRNQGDIRKGDFGLTHKKLFLEWAIKKYGSIEAVREKWNRPDASFGNVPIPTPMERWSEGGKDLRFVLLADQQLQVDDNEFHSKCCFDALEAFGKAIKETCRKAAGCFYGYLADETAGYGGHLAIQRALECPYLDFFSSPKAYHYCLAGDPGASQAASQSMAKKKLWIEENDVRSHHALSCDYNRAARTMEDTQTVFWREIYRALTFGFGFWWMDINGLRDDWYGDAGMVQMFKKQADFFKKWSRIPRKSQAQVLFVLDEQSCGHMTYISGLQRALRMRLEREIRLCGAAVDCLRLNDLYEMDLSQYRFIAFCYGFVLPKEQWNILRIRMRSDVHILFNYAAGLLDPAFSPENQKAVTGFSVYESPDRLNHEDLYRNLYWHGPSPLPMDYPRLSIAPEDGQSVYQYSPDGEILTAALPAAEGEQIMAADFTLRYPLLRKMMEKAGACFDAPEGCTVLRDDCLMGFFPHTDVCFSFAFKGIWRNVLTDERVAGEQKISIKAKKLALFEKVLEESV